MLEINISGSSFTTDYFNTKRGIAYLQYNYKQSDSVKYLIFFFIYISLR